LSSASSSQQSGRAKILGLTGGIGCGKSSVGRLLEGLGLKRLDTDLVARQVVGEGTPGLRAVVERFGTEVLDSDGELNRQALAEIVFGDEQQRTALERILHPLIWGEVEQFVERCRADRHNAVIEVPLLYENSREDFFDEVWVVATTPELQASRLMARNRWSTEEIEARIASQMPLVDKIKRADIVIHNIGTSEELKEQVREAWHRERC
jgi:dephospho-CoA kinase